MKSRTEKIFVKVMRNGYIPQLGISGPIVNPIKITRAQAHAMIVAGIAVYQYFPENQYTEKLTLQNVFGKPEKASKPEEPVSKVVSEPVTPVTLTGVAKEDTIDKKEFEKPSIEEVDSNTETSSNDEVVDEVETTDEKTEEPNPSVSPSTSNNTNNNNYSKKNNNKKKHK